MNLTRRAARTGVVVLAGVAITSSSVASAAGARTQRSGRVKTAAASSVKLAIKLPPVSGRVTMRIFVEEQADFDKQGVPQRLYELPLAVQTVTGGGSHTLTIPITKLVRRCAIGGDANLDFDAIAGDKIAASSGWLDLGTTTSGPNTTGEVVDFGPFHRFRPLTSKAR